MVFKHSAQPLSGEINYGKFTMPAFLSTAGPETTVEWQMTLGYGLTDQNTTILQIKRKAIRAGDKQSGEEGVGVLRKRLSNLLNANAQ